MLFKVPHFALVIFKVAETFLAFINTNVIIVPRIRKISLSFPVVSIASWHLICLRNAFPMVELLIEIDHASCQRRLVCFEVIVYKFVSVGTMPLKICSSASKFCAAAYTREWLANSLAKLAIIIRDIVESFKACIV